VKSFPTSMLRSSKFRVFQISASCRMWSGEPNRTLRTILPYLVWHIGVACFPTTPICQSNPFDRKMPAMSLSCGWTYCLFFLLEIWTKKKYYLLMLNQGCFSGGRRINAIIFHNRYSGFDLFQDGNDLTFNESRMFHTVFSWFYFARSFHFLLILF